MADSDANSVRRSAAVAGVGGGTGFVGIVHLLPEHLHGLGDSLVFAAPAITAVFGYFWIFASALVTRKVLSWHLRGALKRASAVRDKIRADRNSSQEHKDNSQRAVEALEKLEMEALHADVDDVRARLKALRD